MRPTIFTRAQMDSMRCQLYGSTARLKLTVLAPVLGIVDSLKLEEQELLTLKRGWLPWRAPRGVEAVDAITILVARTQALDVEKLKQKAWAEVTINGKSRKYLISEVTERQILGQGWVLHCTPIEGLS